MIEFGMGLRKLQQKGQRIMKRVEYFLKKMAEREAALVLSPASGQEGTARHRVIEFDSILRNLGQREYARTNMLTR